MRRGRAALGVVAVFGVVATVPVTSASAVGPSRRPAPAALTIVDVASISEGRALSTPVMNAARAAAGAAGGSSTVLLGGTIGVRRLLRGTTIVQTAPSGYRLPMTFTAIDPTAATAVYGNEVGAALAQGRVVMGSLTASLRGAQAGDLVDLIGWKGGIRRLAVGAVSTLAPSELMVSLTTAAKLGVKRRVTVVAWGFSSREAIDAQLAVRGLLRSGVRVSRSWEPPYADDLLSQSQVKALLGEFSMRPGIPMRIDTSWRSSRLVATSVVVGARTVALKCHRAVAPALRAAFDAVNAAGLAPLAGVTKRASVGCYRARTVVSFGGSTGGNLSRHSWGLAIDFNAKANCMGCVPTMDCRIVQIFRAHGFAWGGNFLISDGMHFEYVGEPRDQRPTRANAYCPTGVLPTLATGPSVLAASVEN